MSALERMEQQATLLEADMRRPRTDLMGDIQELAHLEAGTWKHRDNALRINGEPTMLTGFTGLEVTPNVATLATATITGTEAALWPTATWTPIANNPQAPKAYRLVAFGTATTAATPGTVLFNARFGQLVTSPLIGVSTTAAQTASQTATPWLLRGDVVLRAGGGATTGLVVAIFNYRQGTAVSAGSAALPAIDQMFGTTTGAVSVVTDGSVAAGLWVGAIAVTSTTNTFIPQGVIWASWN
jgi:hypothetical protein